MGCWAEAKGVSLKKFGKIFIILLIETQEISYKVEKPCKLEIINI